MAVSQSTDEVIFCDTEVVNKAKHNFKTKIGKKYSAVDVIKVWDCISKWIENNMNRDKGIVIKGIGYFTVAKWELNVGKGYPYTISKPVFVVDEKLAKDYNLKRIRAYNTGKIHERVLNLLSVAYDYGLHIDMVNHCFKEVLVAFRKLLYEEKNCELPFPKIGKLQIKNKIVTMKFYQEFLDRQNLNVMTRMEDEKVKFQVANYNPNWDIDQYENQKNRPCSAMSVISRPSSSLSKYRPGTGYEGVLPSVFDDKTNSRPDSKLSIRSDESIRPQSRSSTRSNKPQSRPVSRSPSTHSRPCSRLSVQSDRLNDQLQSRSSTRSNKPQSRPVSRSPSTHSRPCSRLSVQSDRPNDRPHSRSSTNCSNLKSRPTSKLSIQSSANECTKYALKNECQALSSDYYQHRPASSMSNRSIRSIGSATSMNRTPPVCSTKSVKSLPVVVDPSVSSKISLSKHKLSNENKKCVNEKTLFMTDNYNDENICCSCKIRKYRLERTDILKPDISSIDKKDNFMKGDNPLNCLQLHTETLNERKNRLKEISNYNYSTAKELLNAINNEKNKKLKEKNNANFIFDKRPTSTSNRYEKKMNFKNSLLDQIERNKIKKETNKISSIKSEKLMQKELLKILQDERIRNIEAKNQSKKNYLTLLDKHMMEKRQIAEEKKKNEAKSISKTIFGANEEQQQCDNKLKNKNREIANYQLKQLTARNLASLEQKEKDRKFERCLLKKIKKDDETLQRKILQKKLNRKKCIAEDLNKFLIMSETERHKNEIPGAYPMHFPLRKLGQRCRMCKKNALGIPAEKISDLP